MKGLLLKDLYLVKKHLRAYLIMMAAFLIGGSLNDDSAFLAFYPCMFAGMIPVALLGYDERSRWDAFAGAMPVARAQMVSAKYLLGLGFLGILLVLTGILQGIRMGVGDALWIMLGMMVSLFCFSTAVTLPFMFKLGVEKGRIAYYGMVALMTGGSVLGGSFFNEHLSQEIRMDAALLIVCLMAVVLYALSWLLSIRFYEKREW